MNGNDVKKMANELANVLIYNKYLLENKDDLELVIELRLVNFLRSAFDEGRKSVISYDISHFLLPIGRGMN
jgi:hypothetical protein